METARNLACHSGILKFFLLSFEHRVFCLYGYYIKKNDWHMYHLWSIDFLTIRSTFNSEKSGLHLNDSITSQGHHCKGLSLLYQTYLGHNNSEIR